MKLLGKQFIFVVKMVMWRWQYRIESYGQYVMRRWPSIRLIRTGFYLRFIKVIGKLGHNFLCFIRIKGYWKLHYLFRAHLNIYNFNQSNRKWYTFSTSYRRIFPFSWNHNKSLVWSHKCKLFKKCKIDEIKSELTSSKSHVE